MNENGTHCEATSRERGFEAINIFLRRGEKNKKYLSISSNAKHPSLHFGT
jgi:hypothetical protein